MDGEYFAMRDDRKPREFFDKSINLIIKFASRRNCVELYNKACDRESHPVQKIGPLRNGYTQEPLEVVPRMYSRGDDLTEIKNGAILPITDRYLFLCQEMKRHGAEEIFSLGDQSEATAGIRPDGPESTYHSVYTWLCWFICFGSDPAKIAEIAPFLCKAGKDRLIDTVLKSFQPDRVVAKTCMNPETFGLLDKVIDAPPSERPQLIETYLEDWPKFMGHLGGLSSIGIENTYRVRDYASLVAAIGDDYQGFWAWEAALVVKFFNIDDNSFKDNEFYPYDLVHFS
ncbi:PoNe immunity protein domain-containing protein [Sessilibacter corallicola]|uniref:PoNe immunity protein domain-containing protein n=1 Tax=Sessilibacter corallicola TaxID=2904075 RepID=UPI001E65253C|nr:PoNe immunity protein domain-containing protein [Sessilibacter corallicola]MCE2027997.1 DUF1911 domain-containing protein [Sessilibacter corallicola]